MRRGDIVEIKNTTLTGQVVVEGKAKLIKPITPSGMDMGQCWEVRFVGDEDNETFYRWITEAKP